MTDKVFYSWQSDLPNRTNRGFIQRALEDAVKALRADETLAVDLVVDRDTSGVPGAPDIASTIFAKIDSAVAVVADVSVINSSSEGARATPNPNVLIELGYAMKSLGVDRVLMVMNTASGRPEDLPFDLRMRRVITYTMTPDTPPAEARKRLQKQFEEAVRSVLASKAQQVGELVQPTPLVDQLLTSVAEHRADQASLARRYVTSIGERINALKPDFGAAAPDEWDELLVKAIEDSTPLAVEFAKVCREAAAMNATEVAIALYEGFGAILDGYDTPRGFGGEFFPAHFDFHKFIGHELFVTLFGWLIHEKRWPLIGDLLQRDIYVSKDRKTGAPGVIPFQHVSERLVLLEHRSQRLELNRVSLHADLLHKRHTEGELGEAMPFEHFADADYFLFLRSELPKDTGGPYLDYEPWSTLYMGDHVPRFLAESVTKRNADQVRQAVGLETIELLRERLNLHARRDSHAFRRHRMWTLGHFDLNAVGSR